MTTYPFHINPETKRANKCYNAEKCRFGISVDNHYATAAEALAVRDADNAAEELAKASQQYYNAHDMRINALINQNHSQREVLETQLNDLITILAVEVDDDMSSRKVLKALEAAPNAELVTDDIEAARKSIRDVARSAREVRKLDSVYTGWSRYYEDPDGTIHSSTKHLSTAGGWKAKQDNDWLVEMSGKTPEEVVSKYGPELCTKCFTASSQEQPTKETTTKKSAAKAKSGASKTKKHPRCAGSGTENFNHETAELGSDRGNNAECNKCGQRITVNFTGKLRAHRVAEVKTGGIKKVETKGKVDA